ncbi:MAG: hypothetical protein FJX34_04920, partial [Alphaproteobacteria bacterium]|nr:hypothetical protein [Alphaproteobacteria bacterium]
FGHESLETLDRFLSLVFHFNKNSAPNLQKFLEFVEKTDPEISLSATEPNRVRISTIHGAKGLQAPIILMPDCAYNLNRSPQEKILWHGEEPIWCAKRSLENHLVKDLRQAKSQEIFAESLRLLYVGMTRAENELYVGGFGSSNDPKSWYEILRSSLPEKVISSERFFEVTESRKQKDKAESEEEKIINIKKYEKPITTSAIETQDLRKTAFAKKFLFLFGCEERKRIKTYVRTAADEKNKNFEAKGRFCASLENKGQIKGRVTHKILEIFGKNFAKDKKTLLHFANQILLREEKLNEKEKNEVRDLAAKFLDSEQFEKIFNGEVRCEVEVVGAGILGRIDLLIEREDEVLIIDYKSDETVPDVVPQQYLNQLATYKKLIAPLYPNKKISTAILWLNDLVGGTKE